MQADGWFVDPYEAVDLGRSGDEETLAQLDVPFDRQADAWLGGGLD